MRTLRCWQCGVEPEQVTEVTTLVDSQPRYLPAKWPPGDHEHEVDKPTPDELVERGRRSVDQILRIMAS